MSGPICQGKLDATQTALGESVNDSTTIYILKIECEATTLICYNAL